MSLKRIYLNVAVVLAGGIALALAASIPTYVVSDAASGAPGQSVTLTAHLYKRGGAPIGGEVVWMRIGAQKSTPHDFTGWEGHGRQTRVDGTVTYRFTIPARTHHGARISFVSSFEGDSARGLQPAYHGSNTIFVK